MTLPLLFVLLSFSAYRVGRFIALDDLWEGTRNRLLNWLERPGPMRDRPPAWSTVVDAPPLWRHKLASLIGCPWCVLTWTSAFVVGVQHFFVDPLPVPIWWWLAVAGTSAVAWSITDSQ